VENEDSYAFWRRWIILEYPRQFTDADKKPNILQEITTPDELSGLLNYALEGLKRLLTNNKFSYGKSVDEVTEYYMQAADPVYAFASSAKCELKSDAATLKDAVYDAFKDYCGQNKMPILKPNAFARSLQNQPAFHIRATKITVNGVRIPAWQGIKLQESVQDVQDVHDISHFNQSRADAGINITKVEKNTDNPDNPDKKQLHLLTNAPKRLKSLDNCPDCGSENIGAWPDGSDGYYCMDCFPNFNEEVD
jgi:phage/plasmid-associated DNA primase